jgi:RNA polymerase sigma factor (sigma-70 family)
MAKYRNKSIAALSANLSAGLTRLRKGYVDAAEQLMRLVDPDQQYPLEFVVYRLTGFQPRRQEQESEMIGGKELLADLRKLVMDICDSFKLRTGDYREKVYDTEALAERFSVSTKTIQRWRKKGLFARHLMFPDAQRRVAFLESSVEYFVQGHKKQVDRSAHFSQLDDSEHEEILRRARRMHQFTRCTLSEAARRIARKLGRAVETIRYTIRNHDKRNPADAIFPRAQKPLTDRDRQLIYRSFLNGVSIPALATQYDRTRGTVYRIINEMRAMQLLSREIDYMHNPQFDLPDADELILSPTDIPDKQSGPAQLKAKAPSGLPPYLRALYDVPLLAPEEERSLFRQYNYYKYKADQLRSRIDLNNIRTSQLRKIEALLLQANVVKNRIIRANLRLVVSIAKKHLGGPQSLFELISDGNVALMRAVEKFDYARGFRFSTYASWAIMRNFARSVPKERCQLDHFSTGNEEVLDIAASLRSYDPNEANLPELRESIEVMLSHLSPRERTILSEHYGLAEAGGKTFDQLGQRLGISKERVRQIELKALKKLRRIVKPEQADLLS